MSNSELAKKTIQILKMATGLYVLQLIYWLYLEFDLATCAVMPQEKYYKRLKADRWNPF